jgi:C-terminal processing protease CtpA/Prc
VLTSNYTFSGAEEFCYNMQTRDRALLIGEVTGGGANPGEVMTVNSDLEIFIPTGRAINPVTGTNWEGTGVNPDVEIESERALDKAIELILANK